MEAKLTPEKIRANLLNGELNKETAGDLLISLVEGSNNAKVRKESIETFEKIDLKTQKIFKILENCALSDESPLVRSAAVRSILLYFPKEGENSMRWVVQRDKSPIVLKSIFDVLDKCRNSRFELLKTDISNWIEKFVSEIGIVPEEARFILDLEALFANGRQKYEINLDIYDYCESIRNVKEGSPWLVIKNKRIEELNFNYFNWTFLKQVPDSYNSLSKLAYLDLFFAYLKGSNFIPDEPAEIPESIGSLKSLKNLNLSRNKLKNIPESVGSLASLECLDLSHNELESVSKSIGLVKSLQFLNLSHNNIPYFPHFICSLYGLENLNLSHNKLQNVPESIGNLTLLKKLDLSQNNIQELPESIKNLKQLKSLRLSNNKIIKISNSLKSFLDSMGLSVN